MTVADRAEVEGIGRRVTGDPAAELLEWSATPIAHVEIIDTTGGLFRVSGRVGCGGTEVAWSCVLKVLVRSSLEECVDTSSWCYWRREADFFASGLAAGLPGPMRAPRAYG